MRLLTHAMGLAAAALAAAVCVSCWSFGDWGAGGSGGSGTTAPPEPMTCGATGSGGGAEWSLSFGDTDVDAGEHEIDSAGSVAVSDQGDVLVTGWFHGSVDFGGGRLQAPPDGSSFAARFGVDGSHLWSHAYGDGGSVHAVAVDGDANVVLAGGVERAWVRN